MPSDPQFPIVISEWNRNTREIMRVSLDEYRGRKIIDVRTWYHAAGDQLKPGRSGITLSISHLAKLADALQEACRRAALLGLKDSDTGEQE